MAIGAATGVFKTELPLKGQLSGWIAPDPDAHLVHALVKPLNACVLAGRAAMAGGIFRRRAAGNPEQGGEYQGYQDDQGQAHCYSVGASESRLNRANRHFVAAPR